MLQIKMHMQTQQSKSKPQMQMQSRQETQMQMRIPKSGPCSLVDVSGCGQGRSMDLKSAEAVCKKACRAVLAPILVDVKSLCDTVQGSIRIPKIII